MELSSKVLTVIVPAYQVERYLGECLDSLVAQTQNAIEVIVVDDGSKDNTGKIADTYAKQHPDLIRVIHKENAGLGAARNTGLSVTTTPFVAFLDSDDWYYPGTIRSIVVRLKEEVEEPDIVFMQPKVFNMSTRRYQAWKDSEFLEKIFDGVRVTCPRQDSRLYGLEASVCRCVFRTDFLREIDFSFPEGVKWEDVFPHFYLFYHAKRCIKISNAGFSYRINSGSQITSLMTTARYDIIPVFNEIFNHVAKNGWGANEIAYIMQMLLEFIKWFLDASTKEVQAELVERFHIMVKNLPKSYFQMYCNILYPSKKRKLLWYMLGNSVFYKFLKRSDCLSAGNRLIEKLKSIKRGLKR